MKKMKCLVYLAVLFASISSSAQDTCADFIRPAKSSRMKNFIQNPDLSEPAFRRPNVQAMMTKLFAQMNNGQSKGSLSLEPAIGEVGINLSAGFLVTDSQIKFFIPVLTIEEHTQVMQPRRFKPLEYGERQDGISPLLPEFIFAFIGAIKLYSQANPTIKQMIITAAELKSPSLKENLARMGFVNDSTNPNKMILIQDLK